MSLKRLEQLLSNHRLMDQAGGDGADGGGGGTGGDGTGDKGGQGGQGEQGGKEGDGDKGGQGDKGGEGKKPTDEEAKLLKEVMDKKGKIKELNDQLSQVNAKLKEFEGIDPTEVRKLLDERKKLEEKKLEEKGEWDRLKQQMNDAHSAELAKVKGETQSVLDANAALKSQIAELTVGSSFSNSKFIQDELILTPSKARVVYGSHFEFKDGQVIAYDKPAGAKERTMLVDGKGDPLGFEAALQKIVEADPDRDQIKKSKMSKGANSGTTGTGTKPGDEGASEVSGRDKIAKGLASLGKRK